MGMLGLYPVAGDLEPVTGNNQQGQQIELTDYKALFLIISPLHRQKRLFMEEK
jgi:hypothetical protein